MHPLVYLSSWVTSSNAPAWVQAVGSVLAIFIAIIVPAWQRRANLKDAKLQRARDEKERLRRLVAGLRAEIDAAIAAATSYREIAERTLAQTEVARRAGREIINTDLPPNSVQLTDAVVYRAIASELGHFPPTVVHNVVNFYANERNLTRIVALANTVHDALSTVRNMAPRAQMNGAVLLEILNKYEQADFDPDADLRLSEKQMRDLAGRFGYPLDEVLAASGMRLKPEPKQ